MKPKTKSIQDFINATLDLQYEATAGEMLRQIVRICQNPASPMQKSLKELEGEANRLDQAGERMSYNNAHLQKTINEYGRNFQAAETLIQANGQQIADTGKATAIPAVTAKVFLNLTGEILQNNGNPISPEAYEYISGIVEKSGINWTLPNAVDFAEDYMDKPEWQDKMEKWGVAYMDLLKGSILDGIGKGWSPLYIASYVRQMSQNMPRYAAENLTRTLQLTSYRDASLAMEQINGEFIQMKIRIAALDFSTCVACIALHGTPLRPGERVDDHYNGRCSEIYIVPGMDFPQWMQAFSTPGNRQYVPFQTGEDWFASQPEAVQRQLFPTPAMYNAYIDGVPLSKFVGNHEDPVFGNQVVLKSLINALGDDAYKYYLFLKKKI